MSAPRWDHDETWRVDSHEVLATGRVCDFVNDTITTPTGEQVARQYITHPGAVGIIALDDQDRVAVVRQYRQPVEMILVEPPAGLLDVAGENYLHAAQRELAEEAQLAASDWRILVDIFTSPGGSQESLRIFLARGLRPAPRPDGFVLEGEEATMSHDWEPLDDLVDAVFAGNCQSPTLVTGVTALVTARDRGMIDRLRPADAPWPVRERPGGLSGMPPESNGAAEQGLSDASVDDLVVDYLSHLAVERGLSDNTVAAYRRDLDRYRHFLAGRGLTDLAQVSAVDVSEFSRDLARRDLAPASVSRAVVAVRNLHAFALAEGRVGLDVAHEVSPGARPRRLPKALSIESVEALLDSCDTTTVEGLRDRALLELLYGTGARVSEVCSLDVDDLTPVLSDPQQGLRLFGKGGRERVVPLGSYAADAVRGWLVRGRPGWAASHGSGSAPATPALLLNQRGGRLSRQSAWAVIQRAGQRAGITEHLSPHSLRHSFATHLLDGGADVRVVQELLGHASVTTTQIYTLVTVEHLREVYRSSHPRALSSDERDGPTTPVGTTD